MKLGPVTNGENYGPREIVDAGWYDAVCVDVIEDGLIQTKFGMSPCITMVFQLDERTTSNRRHHIYHRLWLKERGGNVVLSPGAIRSSRAGGGRARWKP